MRVTLKEIAEKAKVNKSTIIRRKNKENWRPVEINSRGQEVFETEEISYLKQLFSSNEAAQSAPPTCIFSRY